MVGVQSDENTHFIFDDIFSVLELGLFSRFEAPKFSHCSTFMILPSYLIFN